MLSSPSSLPLRLVLLRFKSEVDVTAVCGNQMREDSRRRDKYSEPLSISSGGFSDEGGYRLVKDSCLSRRSSRIAQIVNIKSPLRKSR